MTALALVGRVASRTGLIAMVLALALLGASSADAGGRSGGGGRGGHGFHGGAGFHGRGHGFHGGGFHGGHGHRFHGGHGHGGHFGGGVFFAGPWWWGPSYPYPPYGYGYGYGYGVPGVADPPVYIQRSPYWYFCPSTGAYYPATPSCPEPWIPVAPRSY
jgi:hypothetical protein